MSTDREIAVRSAVSVIATAAMLIGGTVGCSSAPLSAKPEPGTLPPGTAQLTVVGKDSIATGPVQCWTVESLTTITTGTDASGAIVMVSNAQKPAVEFVQVRNVSGFTGNYNLGLGGDATVSMNGRTYDITGTARGYSPTSIEPTAEPFALKVSC